MLTAYVVYRRQSIDSLILLQSKQYAPATSKVMTATLTHARSTHDTSFDTRRSYSGKGKTNMYTEKHTSYVVVRNAKGQLGHTLTRGGK